ncbi:thiamine-repressible acid phosphatase SPBC21H7.03c-like isoform X2 [Dinothrombium tinctorium]|uniref:Multiple inositol polyphosphate phosphatase 1 n=1 Tax=Dinothrombium tinctorium TaxID=1965070 RepID=A0A3S3P393_9ACAR|nr:thiamine-repressible acid phosphatase SPBC21H7.03c-like isoform X2 [Dinothrombium tinctorium]
MNEILPQVQREIIEGGKSELCFEDFEAIQKWKPRMKEEDDNRLAEKGANETKNIALMYRDIFKKLLNPGKAQIEIGVTNRVRTNQTASSFIDGLRKYKDCDEDESESIVDEEEDSDKEKMKWNLPIEEKDLLNFHKNCTKKVIEKGGKKIESTVVNDFEQSNFMKKLASRVKKRLGLAREVDFNLTSILKKACSYEYAIYGDSPWCAAFGESEIQACRLFC